MKRRTTRVGWVWLMCVVAVGATFSLGGAAHAQKASADPVSPVTVAVVDTGFETGHVWFRDGRRSLIVEEVCVEVCGPGVVVGPGVAAPSGSGGDLRRHGTSVAGVIVGPPSSRPAGRRVELVAVRMFGAGEQVWSARLVMALGWLADHQHRLGLDVVNVSLGAGLFSEGICDEEMVELAEVVARLISGGVIVVAATGNDGQVGMVAAPACVSGVVSVAALDGGVMASWSNRSAAVTVAASGVDVRIPVPGLDNTGRVAAMSFGSGTSLAAASVTRYVAGRLATDPTVSAREVHGWVVSTRRVEGVPVMSTGQGVGFGRAMAAGAVTSVTAVRGRTVSWRPVGQQGRVNGV